MPPVLLLAALTAAAGPPPPGWVVNAAGAFTGGQDRNVRRNGRGSLFLRNTGDGPQPLAVAVQEVRADRFRGSRVRLAGWLKTDGVAPGAGLWLRVDTTTASVGLDNMLTRPAAGTTGWTRHEVVLDVPAGAVRLAFGVLLSGAGTVWADDLELEAAKADATRPPLDPPAPLSAFDPADLPADPFTLQFEATGPRPSRTLPKPTADETAWLKGHLVPFATDDLAAARDDLRPLLPLVGNATVVGLGEATHGTREHFRMKHRLTELLVREKGFTHFLIEANGPETERVNDYVLGGPGDAKTVVAGMLFWTWNTAEVVALVEWLRRYNVTAKVKVQFLGFDMQTGDTAVADTRAFVAAAAPDLLPAADDAFAKVLPYWGTDPAARKAVEKLPHADRDADRLDADRAVLAGMRPAAEVERALRTARVAAQAVGMIGRYTAYRDRCMADNVRHILDRAGPAAKAVLWRTTATSTARTAGWATTWERRWGTSTCRSGSRPATGRTRPSRRARG